MQLRYPAERAGRETESSYDEGAGCGFDNISPDAYAERWAEVDDGATQVMRWFVEQFANLGWHPRCVTPTSGVAHLSFHRDPDERLGILLQGLDAFWWKNPERNVKWDSGTNRLRVHLAVDGVFGDGRSGPHVG